MNYNDDEAKREGWAIFECDDGMLRIQRLDCPSDAFADLPREPIFPSDSAAIAHVERQMARGSEMHTAAMALHSTHLDYKHYTTRALQARGELGELALAGQNRK